MIISHRRKDHGVEISRGREEETSPGKRGRGGKSPLSAPSPSGRRSLATPLALTAFLGGVASEGGAGVCRSARVPLPKIRAHSHSRPGRRHRTSLIRRRERGRAATRTYRDCGEFLHSPARPHAPALPRTCPALARHLGARLPSALGAHRLRRSAGGAGPSAASDSPGPPVDRRRGPRCPRSRHQGRDEGLDCLRRSPRVRTPTDLAAHWRLALALATSSPSTTTPPPLPPRTRPCSDKLGAEKNTWCLKKAWRDLIGSILIPRT
jgi:hypothetical protein